MTSSTTIAPEGDDTIAPESDDALRARILSDPDLVLDDRELMQSLIGATATAKAANIVDLRDAAMERLEGRLDRLEDTHRAVIAAAYDNLAGMNQIHRAVLAMLAPGDFGGFLEALDGEVTRILRVSCTRLVIDDTAPDQAETRIAGQGAVLAFAEPGFVAAYLAPNRAGPPRRVTLRGATGGGSGAGAGAAVYGFAAGRIGSEALLELDLGAGRPAAMLAMGAEDPHQFHSGQGTDLLDFLAGTTERILGRWLG